MDLLVGLRRQKRNHWKNKALDLKNWIPLMLVFGVKKELLSPKIRGDIEALLPFSRFLAWSDPEMRNENKSVLDIIGVSPLVPSVSKLPLH